LTSAVNCNQELISEGLTSHGSQWSNLSLPGALHFVTGNFLNRWHVFTEDACWKINHTHANPVKARLVKSAKDYYWSGFRSFYGLGDEPLAVDHDWRWPDDAEKLAKAIKELGWSPGWYSYQKKKE